MIFKTFLYLILTPFHKCFAKESTNASLRDPRGTNYIQQSPGLLLAIKDDPRLTSFSLVWTLPALPILANCLGVSTPWFTKGWQCPSTTGNADVSEVTP